MLRDRFSAPSSRNMQNIDCLENVTLFFRVDRAEIHYIKSVFEGYDHLCILTTIDAAKGLLAFIVTPNGADELRSIIGGIRHSEKIYIEETGH